LGNNPLNLEFSSLNPPQTALAGQHLALAGDKGLLIKIFGTE
jgi:hypothetical protein